MVTDRCLCIDLRTAAQRLTQAYDEVMAPSGISVTQFSQMYLIHSLDGATLKELASASQLERSTLGRNLRVLEKQGLIKMKVGEDARTRTIHLSSKGRQTLQQAAPLWHSAQVELVERLGVDGRAQLDTMLQTLTAPLAAAQSTEG